MVSSKGSRREVFRFPYAVKGFTGTLAIKTERLLGIKPTKEFKSQVAAYKEVGSKGYHTKKVVYGKNPI